MSRAVAAHAANAAPTPARDVAALAEALGDTAALIDASTPWLAEIARTLAVAREDHGERGEALRWARTSLQDVRDEFAWAAGDPHRLEVWEAPPPDRLARYPDPTAARRADLAFVVARPRRIKARLEELALHYKRFRALGPAAPGPSVEDHG